MQKQWNGALSPVDVNPHSGGIEGGGTSSSCLCFSHNHLLPESGCLFWPAVHLLSISFGFLCRIKEQICGSAGINQGLSGKDQRFIRSRVSSNPHF